MKTAGKRSTVRELFYTFEFPECGYDIAIIPRDEEYRIMLKCQTRGFRSVEEFLLTELDNVVDQIRDDARRLFAEEKTDPATAK